LADVYIYEGAAEKRSLRILYFYFTLFTFVEYPERSFASQTGDCNLKSLGDNVVFNCFSLVNLRVGDVVCAMVEIVFMPTLPSRFYLLANP
jgi:hypothetical protein